VSADFAGTDDLATLLAVAEHGFELLFDGGSTIQIDLDERYLFSGRQDLTDSTTSAPTVAAGLAGSPSPDTVSYRPGILLVPQTSTIGVRAWVQFPRPSADLHRGDDRGGPPGAGVRSRRRPGDRAAEVRGQAGEPRGGDPEPPPGRAGRGHPRRAAPLLPSQAFDRLKQASQNRNLKLHDVATRVIETGAEPENA
jgi:hypothetical protein